MNFVDIILSQLVDPFRIGLLIALMFTTARNVAATGTVVPLLAGIVFVAVMLPLILQTGSDAGLRMAIGLVSNALIVAVLLGIKAVWDRFRPR